MTARMMSRTARRTCKIALLRSSVALGLATSITAAFDDSDGMEYQRRHDDD